VSSKTLESLIKQLDSPAKIFVRKVHDKIVSGVHFTNKEVGLAGRGIDTMPARETAAAFRVTQTVLKHWTEDGCPRNPDNTYSLANVIEWVWRKREAEIIGDGGIDNLKDQKTRKEIEKLECVIAKYKEENISRTEVETMAAARASSLSTFLEKSGMKNLNYFANKSREELETIWIEFIRQAMEAYTDGGVVDGSSD
jgi:hypothetical protein